MAYDDEEPIFDDGDCFDEAPAMPHGVRFGEGQPVNRRGRPRGSPNTATMVRRVARKRYRVMIDGRVRRKNTVELIVLAIQKKAAQAHVGAFKLMQALLNQATPSGSILRGRLFLGEKLNADEWEAICSPALTDEDVAQRLPYMLPARKRFQEYQAGVERQIQEAQHSRRGEPKPDP